MDAVQFADRRIFVTGHRGMVGSAIVRRLEAAGCEQILAASKAELDLRDQAAVDRFFEEAQPQLVLHAAGLVGGIAANDARPAEFLHDNLMMQATVLRAGWRHDVDKLLYLGSSCIYPRDCPQPIKEEYLLTGPLEPTNEAYALAKIAGVKACQYYRRQYGCRFIAAMPTNLYGPGDNFDLESSHVAPALVRKFHEAKIDGRPEVVIWGSGRPRREFMHVDDLADACLFLMSNYDDQAPINVGAGEDLTIAELADLIRGIVYPEAQITFDASRPDGTPQKLLGVSRLTSLGWRRSIELADGLADVYQWFCEHVAAAGSRS